MKHKFEPTDTEGHTMECQCGRHAYFLDGGDWNKALEENCPLETEEMFIYDQYKHFIGSCDIDGNTITQDRLMDWAGDPKHEFYCVFCGQPPAERNGFMHCRRCNDYKGIMPNCNP